MDGKVKKVLSYMKKNGGELEMLDVAFAINLEENVVQNALETLAQEGAVTSRRDEHGKSFWKFAATAKTAAAPKAKPAKSKPADSAAEYDTANSGLETIVAAVEDYRTQTQTIPIVPAQTAPAIPASAVRAAPAQVAQAAPAIPAPAVRAAPAQVAQAAPAIPAPAVRAAPAQVAQAAPAIPAPAPAQTAPTQTFTVAPAAQAMPGTQTIPAIPPTQTIPAIPPTPMPIQTAAAGEPQAKPRKAKAAPPPDDDDDGFAPKPAAASTRTAIIAAVAAAAVVSLIVSITQGGGAKKTAATAADAVKTELITKIEALENIQKTTDEKIGKLEETQNAFSAKTDSLLADLKKIIEAKEPETKKAAPAKKTKRR